MPSACLNRARSRRHGSVLSSGLMKSAEAWAIVNAVADWAIEREDIRAMTLVGSWARGNPHQASDIDLLLLSDRAHEYRRRQKWLAAVEHVPWLSDAT